MRYAEHLPHEQRDRAALDGWPLEMTRAQRREAEAREEERGRREAIERHGEAVWRMQQRATFRRWAWRALPGGLAFGLLAAWLI